MGRAATIIAKFLLFLLALASIAQPEEMHDRPPRVVMHRVQPTYPEIARRLNLDGMVMVQAEVAADGHVKSVAVVSGNAILGQAAVRAVREWIFAPGSEESVPVNVTFNRGQ